MALVICWHGLDMVLAARQTLATRFTVVIRYYVAASGFLVLGCILAAFVAVALVARHPAIGLGMLRSLSERLADAERRLALAAVDVPGRLASHLLDLPGEATPDGWRVTLPWPKKDLASWLATTPESLSRALARLGRDGLVRVDGDEITLLDPDGLEGLASR